MDIIDNIATIAKDTIWEHILFGKNEHGMSIISELSDDSFIELSKLLEILPMMAQIFKCPIGIDDSLKTKRYLFDKLAEYDDGDSDRLYYIPNHDCFKFLRAFIKDGKIEDGVEAFIYRIAHDVTANPLYDYKLMMYWIINFYIAGLLPLCSLQTIDFSIYTRLKEIFIVYFQEGIIDLNSEYKILYSAFMQMSEKKQMFISNYFSRHNYLMSGKSINQFMVDQVLTITDLLSMDDDSEYETQICAMVRNRTL
jgi:hypothetical protein